ncbi:unnamed protein product, partial [Symbiodinium necroappetens]
MPPSYKATTGYHLARLVDAAKAMPPRTVYDLDTTIGYDLDTLRPPEATKIVKITERE